MARAIAANVEVCPEGVVIPVLASLESSAPSAEGLRAGEHFKRIDQPTGCCGKVVYMIVTGWSPEDHRRAGTGTDDAEGTVNESREAMPAGSSLALTGSTGPRRAQVGGAGANGPVPLAIRLIPR
jgi:hypothetical protein